VSGANVKRKRSFFTLGVIILAGCSSTSSLDKARPYRDPVTYSFEAYTPTTEGDPLLQIVTQVKESSRQIREWEKKYLW